jgi:KUP system potassium uptake protein
MASLDEASNQNLGDGTVHTAPMTATSLRVLVLGALGVVFGDIGTSPIYAFREAMHVSAEDGVIARSAVLGILSMIVWSLTIVVTLKYVTFVLRADNRGEGGTLSLMALARDKSLPFRATILILGMLGAALFFGDAIITPAISVLSAVEGLKVVTPAFEPYVAAIAFVILIAVFSVQRFGTARVASVFGPITAAWFLAIGISGGLHIFDDPGVLAALNPLQAARFMVEYREVALLTIGAAVLAVTGAEALYADLGHFGRRPIVVGWLFIVFPCLLLNYFGQGAFVLAHEGQVENPFFEMQPDWFLLPMVVLATAATVIASQAVISGAFSLTRQAVQLNLLPRIDIQHTSEEHAGQIYMPQVNLLLAVGVIILVLGYRESSALAGAYGIAVTGQMVVTTALFFFVLRRHWRWGTVAAVALCAGFGVVDLGLFSATALKLFDGGWVSIVVASVLVVIMLTWVRGSRYLLDKTRKADMPLKPLADRLAAKPPTLVPGTAVFLTSDPEWVPSALLHSLKHYKVLHERNVIMQIRTSSAPRVPLSERVEIEEMNALFSKVVLTFGYMEQPHVPSALVLCRRQGWKFDIMTTSFFVSRRSFKISTRIGLPVWQDRLFIALARNATDATSYFQIPSGRVVEIGTQMVI